jgi:nicotinamide/nicotinate riboside kinase
VKDGLLDWDCPAAISLPDMEDALNHIHRHGRLPVSSHPQPALSSRTNHGVRATKLTTYTSPQPHQTSKEDQNNVGSIPASAEKIAAMKTKVDAWLTEGQPGYEIMVKGKLNLCLFDGFLLYCKEMERVVDLIDIKLFLLVSRAKATQRREARDGYVTLEGFWTDPPGYVDKIVWPNYAEAHAWLFEEGNVEGKLKGVVLDSTGIKAQVDKGLDVDFEETFEWAVDTIISKLEGRYKASA